MKTPDRRTTPPLRGRTRPLRETRGIGPWVFLGSTVVITLLAILLSVPRADRAEATAAPDPVLEVWLVRHAEKADDSRDPDLAPEGRARAEALAGLLAGEGITRVHSTEYRRTRQTAAPVAERLGVSVEPYDPSDLAAFAEELRDAGGSHLVVGHSNTTPALVEALGGDPVSPIEEDEYDRLYRIRVQEGGSVESELRRYGGA